MEGGCRCWEVVEKLKAHLGLGDGVKNDRTDPQELIERKQKWLLRERVCLLRARAHGRLCERLAVPPRLQWREAGFRCQLAMSQVAFGLV